MKLPALKCPRCDTLFGLLVGMGVGDLHHLSDPFVAICIHCETISSFLKVAIKMVPVEGKSMTSLEDD